MDDDLMGAHPDGTGTSWTDVEAVDVDQPHGLDYRYSQHIAKGVRKRIDKEHAAFADATVGGEHVPGYCKILKHVDGTADVTAAKDATLFQFNGIVHSAAQQTVWCITGAASDPTVLLIDPDNQYKGGDITWTGAQQYDASVDMTVLKCVSGTFQILVVDSSANIHGPADMSDTQIDGTLTVLDRADFSAIGVSGDSTITGAVLFDGLVSFCANNLYDSTWFLVEKATDYAKTHDLSSTALLCQVYFKDTYNQSGLGADRIYSINMYRSGVGELQIGPQIQNITTTALTVRTGTTYVAECWSTGGAYVLCTSGSYRVIAMRLV